MEENVIENVINIMEEFASLTGLEPELKPPKRYLWTDAFAVCNYIELFKKTNDKKYQDLSLKLVNQVHHTLGKHRGDDVREGWISGLDDDEADNHPTIGGLRIGKKLNERKPHEPMDQGLEWDQDGQYFHYLTKWMHALNKVSQITEEVKYLKWAIELARIAHKAFTYLPANRERKIMYWKMSIDLSYPLVPSIGQHDPLDGFITFNELEMAANNLTQSNILGKEIAEMNDICRGMNMVTNDPLGIGGLLFDAGRVAQLIMKENLHYHKLLERILHSAYLGMGSFNKSNLLRTNPQYRLAFRELGLSIGFKSIEYLNELFKNNKMNFKSNKVAYNYIQSLLKYLPLSKQIENFWMQSKNWHFESWTEHREINMVMLATSLSPDTFIKI